MSNTSELEAVHDEPHTNALVVLPASAISTVISADKDDILGKLAAKVAAFRPDISTAKGRREIASLADQIASSKMNLVRLANGLMEDDKKRIAAILAERKIIEDRMSALKEQVRQPLTDFENAEKARIADHEAALACLEVHPDMERATSSELSDAISVRLEPEARNWQEFHQRAIDMHLAAIAKLRRWRDAAEQREEQAAELARLQAEDAERQRLAAIHAQQKREAQIAADAAERARIDAERKAETQRVAAANAAREAQEAVERKAASERLDAEKNARAAREFAVAAQARAEKAERDRVDAEAKADRDRLAAIARAERERVEAVEVERARVAKAAEIQRLGDEERAANVAHRKRVNNAALTDLVALGLSEAVAKSVVTAIAVGGVSHISINY